MSSKATYSKAVKLISLCVTWYTVSSANNVVTKLILNEFPYPMTVTMVHLLSTSLYSLPILFIWDIPSASRIPLRLWFKLIIPLSLGKFFASVSSHISLWKVPVSYAHTACILKLKSKLRKLNRSNLIVKATMPLFTVILSWMILKEKPSCRIITSLLPIIIGVAIATVTEISYNTMGLVCALAATLGFAVQNIFSKKCLKETGIHHLRLLFLLAMISGCFMLPFWLMHDFRQIYHDPAVFNSIHAPKLVALLFIESFCGFIQNLVAFTVIAMVTPLSYAVANATKRISIITVSLLTLHNPVTYMNLFGMSMAIFGVLAYNKAKLDQKRLEGALPMTHTYTNGHIPISKQNGIHHASNGSANQYFFGEEVINVNSGIGLPMTPPAQHSTSLSRTKHEDELGNTVWRNV